MKKGISLIVLAITVIVLVILIGVVTINANYMFADTEITKLNTDIAQLESLMSTYKIRKDGVIDFETVEFDTSLLGNAELAQFDGEDIVNNKIELYVIELDKIDAEAVNYGTLESGADDRYLYSIDTGKVYYEQGLLADDITHYYIVSGE